MNVKRYFLAAVAATLVFAGLQYIGPNIYLHPEYEESKLLWRAPNDVLHAMVFLAELFYGFLFTLIFVKGYEGKGLSEGLRFGIYATCFAIAPPVLFEYALQPIPSMLAAKWLALGLGENLTLGLVVSFLYRKEN